jgi:hypothetical protein
MRRGKERESKRGRRKKERDGRRSARRWATWTRRRLWITRGGRGRGGTFPTVRPPSVSRSRAAALLQHRAFVRASVKGSTRECPKGSVLVRHGVCPMLSVVAMGMLLIGRRADRRHGSRGATPTIARRPRPYRGTDCRPLPPSVPPSHDAARLHVRSRRHARANPHDCGLSRVCTDTRAYTDTRAPLTVLYTPFDNLTPVSCRDDSL